MDLARSKRQYFAKATFIFQKFCDVAEAYSSLSSKDLDPIYPALLATVLTDT